MVPMNKKFYGSPPLLFGSNGDRIEFWGQRNYRDSIRMKFDITLDNGDHSIYEEIEGIVFLPVNTILVTVGKPIDPMNLDSPKYWRWKVLPRECELKHLHNTKSLKAIKKLREKFQEFHDKVVS